MQIVIDIDEYIIERANMNLPMYPSIVDIITKAIANGTLIPEPHGRLISEEDMLSVIIFSKLFDSAKVGDVKEALLNIPTIIERSDKND